MTELRLGDIDIKILLEKLRSGDERFVTMFYEVYYGRLGPFAYTFIHDMLEAKEIAHNLLAKCIEEIQMGRNFDSKEKLRNFLYVSTRNNCLTYLRNQQTDRKRKVSLEYFPELTETVADIAIAATEIYDEIYKEIEKLPLSEQKIIILSFLKGYSNKQICAILNNSEQTVKNLKMRALKRLRIALENKPLLYLILIGCCPN